MLAESAVLVDDVKQIRGKRVLLIEDDPTLTHGEMPFGAVTIAAKRNETASMVDPRPCITGTIRETFETYSDIGPVLPAMGYGKEQM